MFTNRLFHSINKSLTSFTAKFNNFNHSFFSCVTGSNGKNTYTKYVDSRNCKTKRSNDLQIRRNYVVFTNIFIAAVFMSLAVTDIEAQEHVVKQQGQKFSEFFLKIDTRDVIKFVNLDTVNHKLSFSYKEHTQSLTDIGPGNSQIVEFSKPGVYDIQCHLHPDMKLTVFVPHVYGSSIN